MKIAEIEIHELQNIQITPPLFKEPVRAAVRLLEIKTDNGITGISQIGGFMLPQPSLSFETTLRPG